MRATLTADADTVATLARAACWRGDEEAARDHLAQLSALAIESPTGRTGWSLPYAWDAFADGSVNPPETIYAYSTALAALAFIEFDARFGSDEHGSQIADAVDTLIELTKRDGRLAWTWYSDAPADQADGAVVLNVSALTLEVLASVDERHDLQEQLVELLVRDRVSKRTPGWSYIAGGPARNDSFHECLVISALSRASGSVLASLGLVQLLDQHFPGGVPRATRLAMGRYGWGPAMVLFTACDYRIRLGSRPRGLGVLAEHVHEGLPEWSLDLAEPERSYGDERRAAWRELALARWEAIA